MYEFLKLYVLFQFTDIGRFPMIAAKALFSPLFMILLPVTVLFAVAFLHLCFRVYVVSK